VFSVFLAFLLLYPLFKIGAMGAGDIKLFIMIGTFCGVKEEMAILVGSFVIGAVFAAWKLLVEHRELRKKKWEYGKYKIHFSVPVLFSAALKMGGLF
jgi:Flp pilus assembly protein protease CpaA